MPDENSQDQQKSTGVKNIAIGAKGVGEDVAALELQIKPKRRLSLPIIAGVMVVIALVIAAIVVVLNFEDISGDIRQRASEGICYPGDVGVCKIARLCTQADIDNDRGSTGENCLQFCERNVFYCGQGVGWQCPTGYGKRCNFAGTGFVESDFVGGCSQLAACGGDSDTGGGGGGGDTGGGGGGGNVGDGSCGSGCNSDSNCGGGMRCVANTCKVCSDALCSSSYCPSTGGGGDGGGGGTGGGGGWYGTGICGNNICERDETCENGALRPSYSGSGDPGSWGCLATDLGKYPSGLATGACRYPGSSFGAPYCAQVAPTPTPVTTTVVTSTPTPTPTLEGITPSPAAMCIAVKVWVYDPGRGCLPTPGLTMPNECVVGDWKEVTFSQLSSIAKVGDTIRFTVAGNTSIFNKARFSINGNTPTESVNRYGSEFYWDYVIPYGGNFSITGELFR